MNNCNERYNNDGQLSARDIASAAGDVRRARVLVYCPLGSGPVRAPIRALASAAALLGGLGGAAAQPDDVKNATVKLAATGVLDPKRALPGQGSTHVDSRRQRYRRLRGRLHPHNISPHRQARAGDRRQRRDHRQAGDRLG